ncbi:MAG: Biotin/lipoate A/B protein ligase [Thelocarpon impressellum]|nr:MAG: Biotin/lipoate A/B protein ligase [Thelocarpon impressellum]
MAPSRGPFFTLIRRWRSSRPHHLYLASRSSSESSRFAELSVRPSSTHQIYLSRSDDPFLNLSIEHHLLQKSPADSTVLFLYANRPCVVIGRNQNPWVEVNLRLLNTRSEAGRVSLVRRRSGGGTVFHDEGNVNYSVICPTAAFDRNKHAEMVVRALRSLGVDRAQVNARHDIVIDQPHPVKVSGSAYKLTRLRALHHGTCLLSSPNLDAIHAYLRSPAKPFIKARGVESVSSPVGNVGVSHEAFQHAVVRQFTAMYGLDDSLPESLLHSTEAFVGGECIAGSVGDGEAEIPDIKKGVAELKSDAWLYLQTPQFTLSSHPPGDDGKAKSASPDGIAPPAHITLEARAGTITSSQVSFSANTAEADAQAEEVQRLLEGKKIHDVDDWHQLMQGSSESDHHPGRGSLGSWLNEMFGR